MSPFEYGTIAAVFQSLERLHLARGIPQRWLLVAIGAILAAVSLKSLGGMPSGTAASVLLVHKLWIQSYDDVLRLQQDLDTLNEWAATWLMTFNLTKCKHLTIY